MAAHPSITITSRKRYWLMFAGCAAHQYISHRLGDWLINHSVLYRVGNGKWQYLKDFYRTGKESDGDVQFSE